MTTGTDTRPIAARLLAWYDVHARDLPWRVPPSGEGARAVRPDPYRVWLSEVMLQQTTVAAVRPYFEAFTARWPTVAALAAADETAVMAAWAGLGYYSRARNLHACARAVAHQYGGRFPESASALKALPGIGDYTSAAIAAIAFDEPVAVVDGNIERVTTRLHRIEVELPKARPLIRTGVAAMTPQARPGDFAQAMMDLGATVCTPRKPACLLCPLEADCAAARHGDPERFPVKAPKRAVPERVGAAFVAIRRGDGALWLRRRAQPGMLSGMSEVPSTAWSARADGETGADAAPFPASWRHAGAVVHGFTHFRLTLDVYAAEVESVPLTDGWWAPRGDVGEQGLPTLMRKVVERALGEAPAVGVPGKEIGSSEDVADGGDGKEAGDPWFDRSPEPPANGKRPGVRDRAVSPMRQAGDDPSPGNRDTSAVGTVRRSRPQRRSRRTSAKWTGA